MENETNFRVEDDRTSTKPRVLVVGAGVSGLTTAIALREAGFRVLVVADRLAPDLTSVVAGVLWEWPPAVCGRHGAPRSLERSKRWSMVVYRKLQELQERYGSEETGIYLKDVYFYFYDPLEERPDDLCKMNELKDEVDGFARGLEIVPEEIDLDFQRGLRDAYKHMAPMVDTDTYMPWLLRRAREMGCELVQERIDANVLLDEEALLRRFDAQAIVSCAGLGSIATAGDTTMFPLRGALVRVSNLGDAVDAAHCISHDDSSTDEQDIIFIVPRGKENVVVLGGLVQQDQWSTEMDLETPIIRQMYEACLQFLPSLKKLPLIEEEKVRTGLRPAMAQNVCVERVPGTRVFYNYGHGGSGVTLSWGCADEIVQRVQASFDDKEAEDVPPPADGRELVFVLHDGAALPFDAARLRSPDQRLVFLGSRRGLAGLSPHAFEHFDRIELVEPFDSERLRGTVRSVVEELGGSTDRSRFVTVDGNSVLEAARLREHFGAPGDPVSRIAPFADERIFAPCSSVERRKTSLVFRDGALSFFGACRCSHPREAFLEGSPVGAVRIQEGDPEWNALRRLSLELLERYEDGYPPNGVLSLDLCIDAEDRRAISVKVSAHPPEAWISALFGFDLHALHLQLLHLQLQSGQSPALDGERPAEEKYTAAVVYPRRAGVVTDIRTPTLNSDSEISWRIYPGQRLRSARSTADAAIIVLLQNENADTLERDFHHLLGLEMFGTRAEGEALPEQRSGVDCLPPRTGFEEPPAHQPAEG